MEVRNIDPKTDNDQNAGKVLGTVIRLVRPARHSPAPNPYRFLIDRALNQNAGEVVDTHQSSHKLEADVVSVGPPATYLPYFITKDDSGNEVWWNPKSKSYEVKNHHNAEAVEATYPPSRTLFDMGISSSSARPAPNSTEPTDLGTGFSREHGLPPVTRGLSPNRGIRHILSRFIDKIVEHSAYSDPSREMTNFGWRKKA